VPLRPIAPLVPEAPAAAGAVGKAQPQAGARPSPLSCPAGGGGAGVSALPPSRATVTGVIGCLSLTGLTSCSVCFALASSSTRLRCVRVYGVRPVFRLRGSGSVRRLQCLLVVTCPGQAQCHDEMVLRVIWLGKFSSVS